MNKIKDAMVDSLIQKYGRLELTVAETAQILGISARQLDDNRRMQKNCPNFLDSGKRYAITDVVDYHISRVKSSIKTS